MSESTEALHAAGSVSNGEPRPMGTGSFWFRPAPDRRKVTMPMRPYAERRAALR